MLEVAHRTCSDICCSLAKLLVISSWSPSERHIDGERAEALKLMIIDTCEEAVSKHSEEVLREILRQSASKMIDEELAILWDKVQANTHPSNKDKG